jgi:hypothetical protein
MRTTRAKIFDRRSGWPLEHGSTGSLYKVVVPTPVTVRGQAGGSGSPPQVYLPGQCELQSDGVRMLLRLWAQSDEAARARFPELLLEELSRRNGPIVAHLLADLHRIQHARGNPATIDSLYSGWQQRLTYASELFSEADLDDLMAAVSEALEEHLQPPSGPLSAMETLRERLRERLHSIRALVGLVRFERLRRRLFEGQNPEIAADRDALLSKATALGFPDILKLTLEVIDAKLAAGSSGFHFKECMDHIRTVLEKVFLFSAEAAGATLSQKARTGKFGETREALEGLKVITVKEGAAIQALYGFISEEGVHAFTSAAEQARIAKNCVIEWSLLVVGRIERKKAGTGT